MHLSAPLRQYVVNLVTATRSHPELRLGASPRATLHLARASRAYAALEGRDYVIPDDVQALAVPVLAHRLIPAGTSRNRTPEAVVADLVQRLPVSAENLTRLDGEDRRAARRPARTGAATRCLGAQT